MSSNDRFKKTLGRINRKSITKERFEALTGTSLDEENARKEKQDMSSRIEAALEATSDEEEKKKLRQKAHLLGIEIE